MKENYSYFNVIFLLYGLTFVICLFNGFEGVGMPVVAFSTFVAAYMVFKKFGKNFEPMDVFYIAVVCLLGVSSCLTGNGSIVFFNTCGMILVVVYFLVSHFLDTRDWDIGMFFSQIFISILMIIPFLELPIANYLKMFTVKEEDKKSKYVFAGILASLPVLFVVLFLLSSADMVFASIFKGFFESFVFDGKFISTGFLIFVGMFCSYSLVGYITSDDIKKRTSQNTKKKAEPLMAVSFLSVISVVYFVFSFIQIFYLFMRNLKLPNNYSYSAYAREGFFQLLFVCIINLIIMLVCLTKFKESMALKVLLTILTMCTYVILASSLLRVCMYIRAYNLTFDRISALWMLFLIAMIFAGCIVNVWKQFPLFKYMVVVTSCMYLCFSLAKPDAVIAKYNLVHPGRHFDMEYLLELSSDATPYVLESEYFENIEESRKKAYFSDIEWQNRENYFTNYNFSIAKSYRMIEKYRIEKGFEREDE